jgi:tetratricopeptide (TPR) repeat protein
MRRLTPALAAPLLLWACSSVPREPQPVLDKTNRAADYAQYGNRAYAEGNYASAQTFFEQALALNMAVDNEVGVVRSLSSIGKTRAAMGEPEEAEEYLAQASRRAAALENPGLELECANSLAEILIGQGQDARARELLTPFLAGAEQFRGTRDLAMLYHNLGVLEKRAGNPQEALLLFAQALELNTGLKAREEMASNNYMIASLQSKLEDYPAARASALRALELDKSVENSLGIAQDLLALGIIDLRSGEHARAFGYFERAYGTYRAIGQEAGMREALLYLVNTGTQVGADVSSYRALQQEIENP